VKALRTGGAPADHPFPASVDADARPGADDGSGQKSSILVLMRVGAADR
jgi:hypothetical protein